MLDYQVRERQVYRAAHARLPGESAYLLHSVPFIEKHTRGHEQ